LNVINFLSFESQLRRIKISRREATDHNRTLTYLAAGYVYRMINISWNHFVTSHYLYVLAVHDFFIYFVFSFFFSWSEFRVFGFPWPRSMDVNPRDISFLSIWPEQL
jgi:hypothetical protein